MNKTFNDLQKGNKIYVVWTDAPKLIAFKLEITDIEHPSNLQTIFHVKNDEGREIHQSVYLEYLYKEKCKAYGRYEIWHTNFEAARKTIKETIQYRIKKKQQIIRESKRALENYKRELKEYEDC